MKKNRVFVALLLVFLLLNAACLALEKIEADRDVSLTITFEANDKGFEDARFNIYRVGHIDADGHISAIAPFDAYNVDIEMDSESDVGGAAAALEGYIMRDLIQATDSGLTDHSGIVRFPYNGRKLKQGIYLISCERRAEDGMFYQIQPVLVSLPGMSPDKTQWIYDLKINPKSMATYILPDGEKISRKVLKIWDDEGYEALRPESISVQLLRDGKVFDRVTLNAEQLWRHTWPELDANHHWTVVEAVLEDYSMSVTQEGITFMITNAYSPEEPVPTPTPPQTPDKPSGSRLPQTGQLWWPVPMLIAVGMLCIIIGLLRRRSN